jgi:hypothetical protein
MQTNDYCQFRGGMQGCHPMQLQHQHQPQYGLQGMMGAQNNNEYDGNHQSIYSQNYTSSEVNYQPFMAPNNFDRFNGFQNEQDQARTVHRKTSREDSGSDIKSDENKKLFEFPEGGWECSKCQNYNFKGRKACFRCKKHKTEEDVEGKPDHMVNGASKQRKFRKNNNDTVPEANAYEYSKDNRVHKYKAGNQERAGDWICQKCFNHNFSFREVCNMCYLSHNESNKMLYQQSQRMAGNQQFGFEMPQLVKY